MVESRATPTALILVYDVVDDGTELANGRVFIDAGRGTPDGFRCDTDGNLWCGWGMGSDGLDGVAGLQPRRQADRPHRAARALRQPVLRRPARNRLFMAASQSVYSLYVNTQGCPGGQALPVPQLFTAPAVRPDTM